MTLVSGPLAEKAAAETLDEASSWALRSSASTQSDDARQDVAAARLRGSIDAFMPTVAFVHERVLSSKISYSPDLTIQDAAGINTTATHEPNIQAVQLSLPLFDGFRRYNNFLAARIVFNAGKHLQLEKRQQVLLDTATAYLTVIRDRKIVELRRSQLNDIAAVAARTQARYSVRDTTQADLFISKSRVIASQTALEQSVSDLNSSSLEYQRLTGAMPGTLPEPDVPNRLVPGSVDELQQCLVQSNPKILAGQLDASAANYVARAAASELSPQVNMLVTHARQSNISQAVSHATDSTVKIQVRIPIYEPEAISRISEANAAARQKYWDVTDSRKQGVTAATTLFSRRLSTIAQIAQAGVRVNTMRKAADAYKVEQSAGFRTIIDTLNARNELTEAQIARANLEFLRDSQTFAIAAALARLGPATPVPAANPVLHLAGLTR